MRFAVIIGLWLVCTSVFVPEQETRVVFGARISMTQNSEMTTFIAMRYGTDGTLREQKVINRDDFIRILSGFWPSPFNPKRINYFEKENIFGGVFVDSVLLEKVPYCPALDNLWKVRYSDYPFQGGSEEGWSLGMYKPSEKQEEYLYDRYGVGDLDMDFFIDTNFWTLLRDVSDSTWIMNYKSIQ